MHTFLRIIILLLTVSGFAGEVPDNWETQPVSEESICIEYVENDNGAPGILAHLPVGLDAETIMRRLWDPYDNANRVDKLKKREIEQDTGTTRVINYCIQVLWARFEYRVFWHFFEEEQLITWRLIDGDLEILDGRWKVLDRAEGKTYLEHLAYARPKLSLLNSFLKPLYLKEMKKLLIEKQRCLQ
ncbi:MAG: hypothetical protein JXB03_12545 [Spirochaetales bacterium]|nr:hypothetical protein [Spirochaetales bacterium]